MKVVEIYDSKVRGGSLNMCQLLNVIFFSPVTRHPVSVPKELAK